MRRPNTEVVEGSVGVGRLVGDRSSRSRPGVAVRLGMLGTAVALVAGACSGGSSKTTSAAPPTRAASGPITAAPTTKAPAGSPRRSEPYWVPLADLRGTGPSTTTPFTVDGSALQWRVTYHCQTAPFNAVALRASGEPLKRPLADAAACGDEGKGFAAEAGTFTVKVTTGGTWDMKVEQQVDSPLVEPLSPPMTTAPVVLSGPVYGVDRVGEGTAKVYKLPDGTNVIRLDDFFTTINSDLELRLSPLPEPKKTDEIAAAPFVTVAPMKATLGSMNYPVPSNIDLGAYKSIVIWCEITRNAYAAVALHPAGG